MAKDTGISACIQRRIDDVFMPSRIKTQLAEIEELQRQGKVSSRWDFN
jgi:hypothetical protein